MPKNVSPLIPIDPRKRFRAIGPAPTGATCIFCHRSDGEVLKIRDRYKFGSKTETLHQDCAPEWFVRK